MDAITGLIPFRRIALSRGSLYRFYWKKKRSDTHGTNGRSNLGGSRPPFFLPRRSSFLSLARPHPQKQMVAIWSRRTPTVGRRTPQKKKPNEIAAPTDAPLFRLPLCFLAPQQQQGRGKERERERERERESRHNKATEKFVPHESGGRRLTEEETDARSQLCGRIIESGFFFTASCRLIIMIIIYRLITRMACN